MIHGPSLTFWPYANPGAHAPRGGRIVIVSNRLPVTLVEAGGRVSARRSCGGLATGLTAVQHRCSSTWIGWTGLSDVPMPAVERDVDTRLRADGMIPIHLTRREVSRFYRQFANGVLWPVLHGVEPAPHDAGDWESFQTVNARFAEAIVRELRPGDLVWVHDYHLMLVPRLVREQCPHARIGFFLHTPFPEPALFSRLPQAAVLLDGLLGSDAIGMHTADYVRNFIAAVEATGLYRTRHHVVHDRRRPVAVFASPMSIDTAEFGRAAQQEHVAVDAARLRGSGPLFVGVDRLDYTKGIPERLRAFERLLERDASLVGRARLIQIAVPSRQELGAYERIRHDVEHLVRRINGRWATPDWSPIDYRYTSIDQTALVALYRAADVMLVTPIRDGMNLVAKEFVASRIDDDGVLVLSERAGAAAELRTALLVDPTDEVALADAYAAALHMRPAERRVRMRHMRLRITSHDVYRWAESVLDVLASDGYSAFQVSGA
jgi:trehalose 6-phosphate synthase/phosphatase